MDSAPLADVTNAAPTPAPKVKRVQWGSKREGTILVSALQRVAFDEGAFVSKFSRRIVKATATARENSEWRTNYRRRILTDAQWSRVVELCREAGMNKVHLSREKLAAKSRPIFDKLGVEPLPEGCKEANTSAFFKEQDAVAQAQRIAQETERARQKVNASAKRAIDEACKTFDELVDEYEAAMFVAYGVDAVRAFVDRLTNLDNQVDQIEGGNCHEDKILLMRRISESRKDACLLAPREPWAARWLPKSMIPSPRVAPDMQLAPLAVPETQIVPETRAIMETQFEATDSELENGNKRKRYTAAMRSRSSDVAANHTKGMDYLRNFRSSLPKISQRLEDIVAWLRIDPPNRLKPLFAWFYAHPNGADDHDDGEIWTANDGMLLAAARHSAGLTTLPPHTTALACYKFACSILSFGPAVAARRLLRLNEGEEQRSEQADGSAHLVRRTTTYPLDHTHIRQRLPSRD